MARREMQSFIRLIFLSTAGQTSISIRKSVHVGVLLGGAGACGADLSLVHKVDEVSRELP